MNTASTVIPRCNEIKKHIRNSHPYLLVESKDFDHLREKIKNDVLAGQWYNKIKGEAENELLEPLLECEVTERYGPKNFLQGVVRKLKDKVYLLAGVYQIEKDHRLALRLWKDLEAASQLADWKPSQFLNVAEMTHAFAVAYDWLYDFWSEDQRKILLEAIVNKGLEQGIKAYEDRQCASNWWVEHESNWNTVCNCGLGIGALAVAHELPEYSSQVLISVIKSLQFSIVNYAPGGGYQEGVMYWCYATRYLVKFLASLSTALGTDFNLSDMPGISDAGYFPIYMTSPIGKCFNFSDSFDKRPFYPCLMWLGNKFDRQEFIDYQSETPNPSFLDLLWYRPMNSNNQKVNKLKLDRFIEGKNTQVVSLRSSWNDPEATYIAIKGGSNQAGHGCLDIGSFVLDALGERWAIDLGSEHYGLSGYWDMTKNGKRWDYYRKRAEGHNTLVINPSITPDQDPMSTGDVIKFASDTDNAWSVIDMTSAYAAYTQKAIRGIALFNNRKQVLIQDELQLRSKSEVYWFMHTDAEIELISYGNSAILKKGDKKLKIDIVSPEGAKLTVMEAKPLPGSPNPEGQQQNEGVKKLVIHFESVDNLRLMVLFEPMFDRIHAGARPSKTITIDDWDTWSFAD